LEGRLRDHHRFLIGQHLKMRPARRRQVDAGGGLRRTSSERLSRDLVDPGADRTGREQERAEAEALSLALGGLPLAHEQAAAYCGRVGLSLGDYRKWFEAAPARLLDIEMDAPLKYRLTVVKAFALALDVAAKLHPAAEPLYRGPRFRRRRVCQAKSRLARAGARIGVARLAAGNGFDVPLAVEPEVDAVGAVIRRADEALAPKRRDGRAGHRDRSVFEARGIGFAEQRLRLFGVARARVRRC